MPVDKFRRIGDRATSVCTGINIANLSYSFLRRDGVILLLELLIWIRVLLIMLRIPCQTKMLQPIIITNAFTTDGGVCRVI